MNKKTSPNSTKSEIDNATKKVYHPVWFVQAKIMGKLTTPRQGRLDGNDTAVKRLAGGVEERERAADKHPVSGSPQVVRQRVAKALLWNRHGWASVAGFGARLRGWRLRRGMSQRVGAVSLAKFRNAGKSMRMSAFLARDPASTTQDASPTPIRTLS